MSIESLPLSEQQRVEHMLGRAMYVHFMEHRNDKPKPPPYVPGWGYAYALIATDALGWDADAEQRLREDYK